MKRLIRCKMIDQLDAIELYYRLYGYLKQKNQEKPRKTTYG